MRKIFFLLVVFLLPVFQVFAQNATEGSLFAVSKKGTQLGTCPLKKTSVKADISGFLARVTVTQEFENNFSEPVEAVYTFPLSQNSAVDAMTMRIGERTIRGRIMKREEARKIYEQAKTDGKTASLLDQQRPNIFTQSVANILPNEKILIEISYVETLKYEDGQYEFVFPMTIAPRYSPGSVKTEDAEKIAPTISPTRAGHTISIEVNLNAGVPVEEIRSNSHEIETTNLSANSAKISLKDAETIPNKDFILRYDVTGKRIEDAILTHRAEKDGFFTLILSPPDKFGIEDVTSKEIVFVLDSSGSMSGFPIEKAKEAINLSLEGLYPQDTFNLITFAGDTSILFDKPVPATQANIEKARKFLEKEGAGGGTEMMKAIRASLEPTDSQEHIRIVCFMTDGLVSNESEIIAEVKSHPKARIFSFGIGNSVNHYLLDKIAQEGRGEAEYVSPNDDGSKSARKFYERVRTPLLTDVSIDWNGLPVTGVYPGRIGDLFSAKPVILHGRYAKAASGTIKLKGKVGGQDYVREIAVNLPENEAQNNVLATLWARTKVDDLLSKSLKYDSEEEEAFLDLKAKTKLDIIALGLKYNLLTEFTSFVAVEEQVRTVGGKPRKIEVPVEPTEGTNQLKQFQSTNNPNGYIFQFAAGRRNTRGNGSGNGSGGGSMPRPFASVTNLSLSVSQMPVPPKTISGGVINGKATNLVKPPYPAAAKAVRASGAVNVQVTIDESGNVISATAVSGHPLLRAAAEEAARNSKFVPTLISGQAIKVTGVIVYNFVDTQNSAETTVGEMRVAETIPEVKPTPLSPEAIAEQERLEKERQAEQARLEKERLAAQQRKEQEGKYRQVLAEKFHFWVFAAFERLQNGQINPAQNEAKFVREGFAEVEIWLTAKTPETLEKLKSAGFEIVSEDKTKIVIGRIAVEKLSKLAEIAEVQYIFPKLK
jgi:Ca-activated chloride channel family protein